MAPADRRNAAAEDLAHAGGRNAEVEIVEYNPAWPAAYQAERERLAPLLPPGVQLHHFGSTAVPGLAAKPVIDMIVLVDNLDTPIVALVERGGYQYPPAFNATLIHRRFLCYPTAAHRTHHLHLVDEPGELERRLHFRDRLRADPVLAGEYVALKRALAERYSDDRETYTEAKSEFVKRYTPDGACQ
ncbi:MAG: GrpB family protein [Solirubrobacteraceae bacterium]